jgi:hypothetical protein
VTAGAAAAYSSLPPTLAALLAWIFLGEPIIIGTIAPMPTYQEAM